MVVAQFQSGEDTGIAAVHLHWDDFYSTFVSLSWRNHLAFYCYDYINLGKEEAEELKNDSPSLKKNLP